MKLTKGLSTVYFSGIEINFHIKKDIYDMLYLLIYSWECNES